MPEELETVLRLVAEGHLTPDEAAPIIEAITRAERRQSEEPLGDEFGHGDDFLGAPDDLAGRVARRVERARARAEAAGRRAEARAAATAAGGATGGGRQLRIRVTERGRQVVNLRIPIGFVETALRFVPGLGGDQSQRIRDAVRSGVTGPIIDVEDPDGQGGVLISVE